MPDYFARRIRRTTRWFADVNAAVKSSSIIALFTGISLFVYGRYFYNNTTTKNKKSSVVSHQRRFQEFASIDYEGITFMSPVDFLQSLILNHPRRVVRTTIDSTIVDNILRKTPSKAKNSSRLFRQLQNEGLISYSDYLFLLQILSKPQSGFEIAFKMLDTNGDGTIDANEFAVINRVITHTSANELHNEDDPSNSSSKVITTDRQTFSTTLMAHLFGQQRTTRLTYPEFIRFIQNIQTEALEAEFNTYAVANSLISSDDFAHIILQHAKITESDYLEYMKRLNARELQNKKIPFDEFKMFFDFLNCMDDFILAVKMYSIASRPLSKAEFCQAAKACTGTALGNEVIDVVFALFDGNGDGMLQSEEFIHVLKNRMYTYTHNPTTRVESFKRCLVGELNKPPT